MAPGRRRKTAAHVLQQQPMRGARTVDREVVELGQRLCLEPRLQRGYDNRRKIFIAQDREDPPPMERLAGWVRLQLLWAAGSGQARGGRKWADGRLACMKCVDLVQESWSPSDRANARACTSSSRGTMRSTMP